MRIQMAAVLLLLTNVAFGQNIVRNFDRDYQPGEFLIKFKSTATKSSVAMALSDAGVVMERQFRASGALLVSTAEESNVATMRAVEAFADNKDVEYIEANTLIRLSTTPDDPRLDDLWGMEKISAQAAWEINTGSSEIVVGIIDTGVDHEHADIAENYWYNQGEMGVDEDGNDLSTNGIDDDGNGYIDDFRGWDFANDDNDPMDDHDHGTHCAGTIGGKGNNGIGVVGVNWNVGLVGLKFITAQGQGSTADAIEAVEYATMMGFDLTSNSWGGGGFSQPLYDAIAEAQAADVLFVAAAGNSYGNSDRNPLYPAAYDLENIISVAATDSRDRKANFSNYGVVSVDIGAPGVSIYSTTANGSYGSMSGTSMAAPHIAGAVALVKAQFPELSGQEVRQRLLDTVDDINLSVATGGRLNLEAALTE